MYLAYVTRVTDQRPRLWSTLLVQLPYGPLSSWRLPVLRSLFLHILQTVYMDRRGPD
jgi:hypothetical protein